MKRISEQRISRAALKAIGDPNELDTVTVISILGSI